MNQVRSPEQIEQEISLLRAQIDHTLDAVQEKLSPGELLDQALTYVKDETGAFAGNFGRAVQENPVPAALLGISLAWLMVGARSPRRSERPVYREGSTGWDRWDQPAAGAATAGEGVAEAASDGLQAITAKAEQVTRRLSESVTPLRPANLKASASGLAEDTADRLRRAREQARARLDATRAEVKRSGEVAADFMKSNPMTMVAVALAAGALAAALLPRTRREDDLMGETRDEFVEQASETVKETTNALAGSLAEVAERTLDEAVKAVEETVHDVAARASGDSAEDEGDGRTDHQQPQR